MKEVTMSNKKQSSIEWLEWQINLGLSERGLISAFKEAKQMHKEEVQDAYQKGRFNGQTNWGCGNDITAESYYNETFGGKQC